MILSMESVFDIVDIAIDILSEVDQYACDRYSDKQPYESECMFREEEHDERDEYREVDVRRDDTRIEIVGLDYMDDEYHEDTSDHDWPTTESVSDDDDRDRSEEYTEYRDKSENKYHQCYRDDIWECTPTNQKSDNQKPKSRQHRIDHRNESLCSEDEPETFSDLPDNDRSFIIEKRKIPFLDFSQKNCDLLALEDKEV